MIDLEGAVIDLTNSDDEKGTPEAGPSNGAPTTSPPGPQTPVVEQPALACGICWEPFNDADRMPMRMWCCHVMCSSCRPAFAKCPFRDGPSGDGYNAPPEYDTRLSPSRGSYTECRRCGKTSDAMFAFDECGHIFCKHCRVSRFTCDCGSVCFSVKRVYFP